MAPMATITKHLELDAPPDAVWEALADFGAVHVRLAPGFVTDCRVDGGDGRDGTDGIDRVVTFFSGAVARERLVTCDHERRRLVYTVVDSAAGASHHQASAEVRQTGDPHQCRLVWTTDLLPDTLAPFIDQMMERGGAAMADHFRLVPEGSR